MSPCSTLLWCKIDDDAIVKIDFRSRETRRGGVGIMRTLGAELVAKGNNKHPLRLKQLYQCADHHFFASRQYMV
jgi:hypothetical protein